MIAIRSVWRLVIALLISNTAHGFGAMGHRLIGELAQTRLNPVTALAVQRLLQGQSLVSIASWADDVRDERRETAPWHYMNFSAADCRYQPQLDCPKGNCLVPMLQKQILRLQDRTLDDAARGEALRFVVHLMGDLHQPLHLGFAHDKGGNKFQIAFDRRASAIPLSNPDDPQSAARQRWWQARVRGYNLHSLWDTQLLESATLSEHDYVQQLQQRPAVSTSERTASVSQIAQQSCRIVREADFYPPRNRINRSYVEQQRPRVNAQLRLAGERLAELLNATLGD
jgi:hypothetical protein